MSTTGEKIRQYRINKGLTQEELGKKVGVQKSAIAKYENGRVVNIKKSVVSSLAKALDVPEIYLMDDDAISHVIVNEHGATEVTFKDIIDTIDAYEPEPQVKPNRIPVLGSVPAGIPIEAIEDVIDFEDIPMEWLDGGRKYFALTVKGDSMSPKYLDGDTIIIRQTSVCDDGQDAVVYVNGYDATFKKVLKRSDHIILQPLNPDYEPQLYYYDDPTNPVTVAGVVVELRRSI